jgi:tRNA pseudouridine55 synthase
MTRRPMPRPARRRVDGILLLDKPPGPSSNAVLQRVKRLYRAEKAGHTGSLDPLASGLLPICLGEATKLSGLLLGADKGYVATARLGVRTDTLDADGLITAEAPVAGIDAARIEASLQRFRGPISQIPPMHSALKRDGTPLYQLARQGVEVERAPRAVTIHRLELLAYTSPMLELAIDCSSGTYIRTLVDDLGLALGCGAHVQALRRTWAAPFTTPTMYALEALEALDGDESALDALLLPPATAVAHLPQLTVSLAEAARLRHGNPVQPVRVPQAPVIAAIDPNGELIGIGRSDDGVLLHPDRILRPSTTGASHD